MTAHPEALDRIRQAAETAARTAGYCWELHPGEPQECTRPLGHAQASPPARLTPIEPAAD